MRTLVPLKMELENLSREGAVNHMWWESGLGRADTGTRALPHSMETGMPVHKVSLAYD